MKPYDVQSVALACPARTAFAFIAAPQNLPRWTHAFAKADETSARLRTPEGEVTIELATQASAETGAIDWIMRLPDGAEGKAYSRVTPNGEEASIYSFVLMAPPAPLVALEGALAAQKDTLAKELLKLKHLLESA